MDEPERLRVAEDALRAGDEVGVWSAVRWMKAIDQAEPPVVDLKVRTVTAFQRFDEPEAKQWADLLSFADDRDLYRLTIAEFYWHRAAWLCKRGEWEEAGQSVKEASRTFPDIRDMMNDDPRLERLLFGGGSSE